MKPALTAVLVILALLAAGCISSAPVTPAPVPAPVVSLEPAPAATIPDLKGTWTGTAEGYREGTGFYTATARDAITLVVSEQQGRIFAGHVVVRLNGTEQTKGVAGAIGADGRTLTMVEKDGGYSAGTISGNGMEMIYMLDSPAYNIAIDTLKKV